MSRRTSKRKAKHQGPTPRREPGRLSRPAPFWKQALLFLVAFGQTILTGVLVLLTGYVQIRFFWFHLSEIPDSVLGLLAAASALFLVLYLRSPVSKRPRYHDLPLERIDFSYVFRFQWRFFFFGAFLASLNMIPALYSLGTIDTLADLAVKYDSSPDMAKTVAWIGTAALSGVIGNLATLLLFGLPAWIARRYTAVSKT